MNERIFRKNKIASHVNIFLLATKFIDRIGNVFPSSHMQIKFTTGRKSKKIHKVLIEKLHVSNIALIQFCHDPIFNSPSGRRYENIYDDSVKFRAIRSSSTGDL